MQRTSLAAGMAPLALITAPLICMTVISGLRKQQSLNGNCYTDCDGSDDERTVWSAMASMRFWGYVEVARWL
ncbi:Uncharacterized protein HZ326_0330 [Fusarium oxysporum f. sp. albedinis]|nr:Uncharacterized protein HZ326_0330 [Fusarium oxysporum f. sp. albedinis]